MTLVEARQMALIDDGGWNRGLRREPHPRHAVGGRDRGPFRGHRLGWISEPLLRSESERLVGDRRIGLSKRQSQLTPAYECNPTVTRLMKNKLNTIATNPATLIHADFRSRHPAVERACRYAA
jgi:hypothetical protein